MAAVCVVCVYVCAFFNLRLLEYEVYNIGPAISWVVYSCTVELGSFIADGYQRKAIASSNIFLGYIIHPFPFEKLYFRKEFTTLR